MFGCDRLQRFSDEIHTCLSHDMSCIYIDIYCYILIYHDHNIEDDNGAEHKKIYHIIKSHTQTIPCRLALSKKRRETHTYFNSAQVQNSGSHLENKKQHALKQQHQHGIATRSETVPSRSRSRHLC